MIERSRAGGRTEDSGFVLVGVVMFILVLTILGLSLFSLSSFESQFFDRSYRGSKAFYEGVGGLDRARWLLLEKDSLSLVAQALPPGVEARAYQDKGGGFLDSLGRIQWGGAPINIRVTTTKGDIRQAVEAQYQPTRKKDLYKRLMTLSGVGVTPNDGLWVYDDNGGNVRWSQTILQGKIWQNAPAKGPPCDQYVGSAGFPDPVTWIASGGVPDPDVQTYIAAHSGGATLKLQSLPPNMTYGLNAAGWPDRVGFFRTPSGGDWSLEIVAKNPGALPLPDTSDVIINVHGTVVWMFDAGFFSQRRVRVEGSGDPEDLLVLVARPTNSNGPHRFSGFAMFGGFYSPTVPVIMVASRRIELLDFSATNAATNFSYLSIYAQNVELMGPPIAAPAVNMTLVHAVNAAPDQPGTGVVDRLYQLDLLPNMVAGQDRALPLLSGTWRQITLNN